MIYDPYPLKRCVKCGLDLPIFKFYNDWRIRGGHKHACKACLAIQRGAKQRPQYYVPDGMKRCSQCERVLPETSEYFNRGRTHRNGLRSWCKDCDRVYRARYSAEHNAVIKQRRKEGYYADPDRHRGYAKKSYHKDSERRRAKQRQRRIEDPEGYRAKERSYYAKDPKRHNARGKKYKDTHRDELRKKDRERYANNADAERLKARQYRIRNPLPGLVGRQRREAHYHRLPHAFLVSDWRRCLNYFDHRCAVCGRPRGLWHTLAMDHWVPLSSPSCPGTIPENIVPLCHALPGGEKCCNNNKKHRDPVKWLTEEFGEAKAQKILERIERYFQSLKDDH